MVYCLLTMEDYGMVLSFQECHVSVRFLLQQILAFLHFILSSEEYN